MACKVEEYEKVLRFLNSRLEGPEQALVQGVLEKVRTSVMLYNRASDQLT